MTIGEKIRETRKEKGISVEVLAKELGVSKTTIYRYEDATIEKIPVRVFDRLCKILEITPAEMMGNGETEMIKREMSKEEFPHQFHNPQDAMEFILKTPTLAAFGGYDPSKMSEETILAFANDILKQLELVSLKYR